LRDEKIIKHMVKFKEKEKKIRKELLGERQIDKKLLR
jgi:hypothetical protein